MDQPSLPDHGDPAGADSPEPNPQVPEPEPPEPAAPTEQPPREEPVEPPAPEPPAPEPPAPEPPAPEPPAPELPPPAPQPAPAAATPAPPRPPQRPPDAARCHRGLRSPVPEVWPYLSRPDLLRRWMGDAEIELAVGGDFSLRAWNGDVVRGRVLAADPPSALSFTWRPHGHGPESRVEIRLQGDGPGARILVRHDQLASEPERRQARRLWREALGGLRKALHGDADAHAWGATLPIAVRMPLARTAADVWPLLATAAGLEKWLARVERFDGVPEGAFRLSTRSPAPAVAAEGAIDAISPETRIALSWEQPEASWGARTKVELLLEADPSGAALLLLHSGFDKIAPEAAATARRHYAAFWPKAAADLRRLVAPLAV